MLILIGWQIQVRQPSDYIMNKTEFYADLNRDFNALMAGETSFLATLANTSALLYERLTDINWAGFYLLEDDTLVLGPFQGKIACVRIPVGRGVCGTAVARNQVQRIEDVHVFDVIGWRLDDVVALIKGPKGSKVRLEILPAGKGTKTRTVTLTRERIRLEDRAVKMSVKTVGKEKVGVLDIPGFYVGLTDDVKVQLQKLEKQNVSSVIIDLRSNGGGALTEAVSLSGLFIPAGPIVQVRDNNGKVREDSDTDGQVFYKGPLVVLVDRFSASASEIFAAAMQDYGRALVVGEPTFGKGTVQQYRSLNRIYDQMLRPEWPALGSVQYTIQKFYRVNGGSTQRKGVTPDIIMPTGNEETETGEKFEDNALPWDSIDAATYVKSGDLTAFEPELLKEHNARIAKDPEFQNIMKDIARFNAMKDKRNIVSLNYAVREKENNEDDATRLARLNERFKREGKPELKKLDDLPKDYQEPDPYLDETVNIALDLAKLEKARPAEQPAPVK